MKDNGFVKVLLIVGLVFLVLGGTIFTVAMFANKWDFTVLSSHVQEKQVVEITNEDEIATIEKIDLKLSTADVKYLYHDENKIIIEGYKLCSRKGELFEEVSTKIENGTLSIRLDRKKVSWFQIGAFGENQIIIKMPKDMKVELSVELSTGDVFIGESNKSYVFSNINITTSTGDVSLVGDINCQTANIKNSTGDTYINGKLTVNNFTRNADTGDFIVNAKINADKITVSNTTGEVICNAYITANLIDVETSTGDITLKLLGSKSDYSYTYDISTGDSNISAFISGAKQIKVIASTGDANIYFER
ncbi:MAG: hypothetical protein IKA99_00845 [Clostridia bacterium]|nr:hypothetical protein [Clostridia bacterium]